MTAADGLVSLLDCDSTLRDNDRVLADLEQRHPARHCVMVDDKPRILAAMKKRLGDQLTTVYPRQGRYALDPHNLSSYPPADLPIVRIGGLRHFNVSMLVGPARGRDRGQEAT